MSMFSSSMAVKLTRVLVAILVGIALAAGGGLKPAIAKPLDMWTVNTTFIGRDGADIPLRDGNDDFGKRHIEVRGHLVGTWESFAVQIDQTLRDGTCASSPTDDKVTCSLLYEDNSGFSVTYTERVDPASLDGRPVGVITAYEVHPGCRLQTVRGACP
ncbi:hypothetical protein [Enemella evansiae]|uniref:hypothetical protein n=1 Tax=Enemella evansiae TaxID=2016499 RepID=UPI00113FDCF0|nr:hypothetical protein [Enemella evansiae]